MWMMNGAGPPELEYVRGEACFKKRESKDGSDGGSVEMNRSPKVVRGVWLLRDEGSLPYTMVLKLLRSTHHMNQGNAI